MSKPFGGQADSPLREMFPLGMAVLDEIPTDDTGHVKACGYDETEDCRCSDVLTRIEAAITTNSPDVRIINDLLTLPWGLDEDINGADLVDTVFELLMANGRLTREEIEAQRAEAEKAAEENWREPEVKPGDRCASYKIGKTTVIEHREPCEHEGKTMTAAGKVLTKEDLRDMLKAEKRGRLGGPGD